MPAAPFRLRDSHSLRLTFPCHSATGSHSVFCPYPVFISKHGLASSDFARHYSRNLCFDFFSSPYLDVSVRVVPLLNLCIQLRIYGSSPQGLPHSEIRGSKVISTSPRLIAGNHVLLRLSVPRHSPYALFRLNSLLFSCLFSRKFSTFFCISFANNCLGCKLKDLLGFNSLLFFPPWISISKVAKLFLFPQIRKNLYFFLTSFSRNQHFFVDFTTICFVSFFLFGFQ